MALSQRTPIDLPWRRAVRRRAISRAILVIVAFSLLPTGCVWFGDPDNTSVDSDPDDPVNSPPDDPDAGESLELNWGETPRSGSAGSYFAAVAAASGEGLVIGGSAKGTIDFGNAINTTAGSSATAALLVSYDSDGDANWAFQESGSADYSNFAAVATDSSGNIYALVRIKTTSTWNFGNGITVSGLVSGNHGAVVKFNASGTAQWSYVPTTAPDRYEFYDIAVADGTIYIAGIQRGNGEFTYGSGVTAQATVDGRNHALVLTLDATNGTAQDAATTTASLVRAC